jgi:hypothetical protein
MHTAFAMSIIKSTIQHLTFIGQPSCFVCHDCKESIDSD